MKLQGVSDATTGVDGFPLTQSAAICREVRANQRTIAGTLPAAAAHTHAARTATFTNAGTEICNTTRTNSPCHPIAGKLRIC